MFGLVTLYNPVMFLSTPSHPECKGASLPLPKPPLMAQRNCELLLNWVTSSCRLQSEVQALPSHAEITLTGQELMCSQNH
uniref:Uncharacterized protein n=1 Tax=Timema douglasi TaxID=61478 RepID=A0A7R8VD88_TIMDO|nr:unnamed protein product [Timema douglasi]